MEDVDRYIRHAGSVYSLYNVGDAGRRRYGDLTRAETISLISQYCSELLIHAADVEGLCQGIDEDLVRALGERCRIPVTYAGGARELGDLDLVDRLSDGKVDLTFGSYVSHRHRRKQVYGL